MRAFLDTSVLVPIFMDLHPHHEASHQLFAQAEGGEMITGVHNLAELYATLTRIPTPYRFTPFDALLAVSEVRERVRIVAMPIAGYFDSFERAASLGIMGRSIHDALIAQCAIEAKADIIYTWNVRHFRLFGPEIAMKVRTP